ncbi:MAG: hypothetical protein PHN72_05560 [Bacilli bacterium]|nr:hypothetical protein [Bacilli bacterium]
MEPMETKEDLELYATKHTLQVNGNYLYNVYIPDRQKNRFLSKLQTEYVTTCEVNQNTVDGWSEKYVTYTRIYPLLWDLLYKTNISLGEIKSYLKNEEIPSLEIERKKLDAYTNMPADTLYDGYISSSEKKALIQEYLSFMKVPTGTEKEFLQFFALLSIDLFHDELECAPQEEKKDAVQKRIKRSF